MKFYVNNHPHRNRKEHEFQDDCGWSNEEYQARKAKEGELLKMLSDLYDDYDPSEEEIEMNITFRRTGHSCAPDDMDFDEYGNPIDDDIYTDDDMYWDEMFQAEMANNNLKHPYYEKLDWHNAMEEGIQHMDEAYLEDEIEDEQNVETIDQQYSASEESSREVLMLAPIQKLTEHGWQDFNAIGSNQIFFCDRDDFFAERNILVSIYEKISHDNGSYCSGIFESMCARFNLVRIFSGSKYHYLWLQDEEFSELINDYEKLIREYPVPNGIYKKYIEDTWNRDFELSAGFQKD